MEVGAIIGGRFVIEREAASGGMGTVFRAADRLDGSTVALKVLRRHDAFDAGRFDRESRILAELNHPGIVRYVAHGATDDGEQYLAMEWLEGEDLSARLSRRALSPIESLAVLRRTADALGFAHAKGVIHRDVKPSNLFLVAGDVRRLKVLDFGIARPERETTRLTYTGGILGTPGFMAPEQIEGQIVQSPTADVFSLGCVAFECLTGRPAFEGAHMMAALAKLLFHEPPRLRELRPEIPEPLERLVARMLAKNPEARPRDAGEVASELARLDGVLAAWALPEERSTLASAPEAVSQRAPDSLTLTEQRLVSVVLAGDPDEVPPRGAAEAPPLSTRAEAGELREIMAPFGAHLVELGGGSLIALISGAGSAVDRAERAARCALALLARFPDVPICVATGRGVASSKLLEGDVIERGVGALRAARPGCVRLDHVTAEMLGARFTVSSDAEGRFIAAEAALHEGAPLLLGKPSPWVGRSRELSMLEGVFSGCVSESLASAVLVVGPAGSGKSRLRLEFMACVFRQPDTVEVLVGRASSVAVGSPYGIIADAIRRAAGIRDGEPIEARCRKLKRQVGRHLDGAALSRVAAFLGELTNTPFPDGETAGLRAARENAMMMSDATRAAWEDWLSAMCAVQPVLLVLEDLHWGDAATVRLIDATLRNLRDLPLMLLVLARPEVHKQFPALWADREVQVIKLGPLPPKACEKLVRGVLGEATPADLVAEVVERSDGNPFYLEELIRAVAAGKRDALPDSVLGTVEARLDAEGLEAKRVLRAASVFGDRFSKLGVAALLGGDAQHRQIEEWLEALAARELIASAGAAGLGPREYVFRHAIVREAAYATLTEKDRVLGHKLAGEWLERTGHTDAMSMAEHFRRGREPARAVRWYRRAAEQALEANDLGPALERAELAVQCGAAGEELGAIRLVEAEIYVWRAELPSAEQQANEAVTLLPAASPAWFRAITQAVIAAGRLGAFDRVAGWVALAGVAAAGDNARRAQIICLGWCATYLVFGGRYAQADELIDLLDRADSEPPARDPAVAAMLQQMRAIRASTAGDPGACLEKLELSLEGYEIAGDHRNACVVRSNIGFIRTELGDFEGAEETLRSALAAATRMGLEDIETVVLHNLGHTLALRGRLDEARVVEQRAIDAFHRQGEPRTEGVGRHYLAEIEFLAGDLERAEREARAAVEMLKVAPALRAAALAMLSRILLARGRAAEALEAARQAHAELLALGSLEEGESLVRLAYAEALSAAGEASEASSALSAARAHLLGRAARISDAAARERFLTQVPDNARTLALAPT